MTLKTKVASHVSRALLARERKEDLRRALADVREENAHRVAAERELRASESKYRLLISNLQDVVLTLSVDGAIDYASPSVERMFGLSPESLVGAPIDAIFDEDSSALVFEWLVQGLQAGSTQLSLRALTAEAKSLDVEVTLAPLAGATGEIQAIIRDVTARKRYENDLLHMASHDFLTGMYNRRRFEEDLAREVARANRTGTKGAVLWLDLDSFKDVNDTLGHRAGDDLLIVVAGRLAETSRAESVVARIGGDEFAVLLPGADREEAEEAASRMIGEIGDVCIDVDGRTVRISTSVGVVVYPDHGTDVENLLARADIAMYRAKELGRARYQVYEEHEGWHTEIERGQIWTEMLQLALAEGGLQAYAQPIASFDGSAVARYELLVRMTDLDGGTIPPAGFLPIAERTGLIVDVDLWMIGEAIRLLVESPAAEFGLSVNASPRSIGDERYLHGLENQVRSAPIDASRLTVEMTETAVLVNVAKARDALQRIKQIGCRVALDDFGTGFTSFLHLKQLPFDDVKIDGSFVLGMLESANDRHLVRAMVEMSHGLNMSATAEYVESPEALTYLKSFGVDMAQGYAVGRPGPARDVLEACGSLPKTQPDREEPAGVLRA